MLVFVRSGLALTGFSKNCGTQEIEDSIFQIHSDTGYFAS